MKAEQEMRTYLQLCRGHGQSLPGIYQAISLRKLLYTSGSQSVVPRISSIGITWKLVRNLNSQPHPRCTESETLGWGPGKSFFVFF